MSSVLTASAVMLLILVGGFTLYQTLAKRDRATLGWVVFSFAFSVTSVPLAAIFGAFIENNLNSDPGLVPLLSFIAEHSGTGLAAWIFGLFGLIYRKDPRFAFSVITSAVFGLLAFSQHNGMGPLTLETDLGTWMFIVIGFAYFAVFVLVAEQKKASSI